MCSGEGTIVESHPFGDTYVNEVLTCPACAGRGHAPIPCRGCTGEGYFRDDREGCVVCNSTGYEEEKVTSPIDLIQMLEERSFECQECGEKFANLDVNRTMSGGNFVIRGTCECGNFSAIATRGDVRNGVQAVGAKIYRSIDRQKRPMPGVEMRTPEEWMKRKEKPPELLPEPSQMNGSQFAAYMRSKRSTNG